MTTNKVIITENSVIKTLPNETQAMREWHYYNLLFPLNLSPEAENVSGREIKIARSETGGIFSLADKLKLIDKMHSIKSESKYTASFNIKIKDILLEGNFSKPLLVDLEKRNIELEKFMRCGKYQANHIHGDFHSSNIVGLDKPLLIDFEYSGKGNRMWDTISIAAANILFDKVNINDIEKDWPLDVDFDYFNQNVKHRIFFSTINMLGRHQESNNNDELIEFEKRLETCISGKITDQWSIV